MNDKLKSSGEGSNPFDLWATVENGGSHNLLFCFCSYQVETIEDKCFPDFKLKKEKDNLETKRCQALAFITDPC